MHDNYKTARLDISSLTIKYAPLSFRTGGNRKNSEQSMNADHKSLETVFLIAIFFTSCATNDNQNTVSNDLRSMFVDSINVFHCHLSEVFIVYRPTEYIAKTIRNNGY